MKSDRSVDSGGVREIPVASPGQHPLQALRREIGHMLDMFYEKVGKHHHAVSGHVVSGFSPEADLSESPGGFQISMELPGIDESDIEVLTTDDRLIVRGEKKAGREVSEPAYFLSERRYGRFERSFRLPPGVDGTKAKAQIDNGLLTIDLPPPAGRKAGRRIPVTSR